MSEDFRDRLSQFLRDCAKAGLIAGSKIVAVDDDGIVVAIKLKKPVEQIIIPCTHAEGD